MQEKAPVSTASRLKCGAEYPTIKVVPHDGKGKMGMLFCAGAPVFTQRRFPPRFLGDPVSANFLRNCCWIFPYEHSDVFELHASLQCLLNVDPVRECQMGVCICHGASFLHGGHYPYSTGTLCKTKCHFSLAAGIKLCILRPPPCHQLTQENNHDIIQ